MSYQDRGGRVQRRPAHAASIRNVASFVTGGAPHFQAPIAPIVSGNILRGHLLSPQSQTNRVDITMLRGLCAAGFAAAILLAGPAVLAREAPAEGQAEASSGDRGMALDVLVPGRLAAIINPQTDKTVFKSGTFRNGDVLLSVPYVHRHVVRATQEVNGNAWGMKRLVMTEGTEGFEGLPVEFRGYGLLPVYCFFHKKELTYMLVGKIPAGYGYGSCFAVWNRSGDPSHLFILAISDNLPTMYQSGDAMGMDIKSFTTLFEDQAQPIDHAFQLDLVIKKVADDKFTFQWRSEGVDVDGRQQVAFGADGAFRIALSTGTLVLKRAKDSIDAEFISAPPQ